MYTTTDLPACRHHFSSHLTRGNRTPVHARTTCRLHEETQSIISFNENEGLRPTPGSPWVPVSSVEVRFAAVAAWGLLSTILTPAEHRGPAILTALNEISEGSLEEGNAVWEDVRTLQWDLHQSENAVVPVGSSVVVNAFVNGPQPQDHQLVVVKSTDHYNLGG